ncbi:MAG: thioredoxin family protein [Bacteroidetes bacterium]|nr:thioredoxin family protein [Bacteroidota bacterium]
MKTTAAFFSSLLIFCFHFSSAQILAPASWEWKAEQTGKGEYKLVFTAKIDKGWHIYSQHIGPDGPVPTSFKFETNKEVELIGKTTETGAKTHEGHDPVFEMQLKYFEESMTCTQKVKVSKDTKLKGSLEFMLCDDSRCLPPEEKEFEFNLSGLTGLLPQENLLKEEVPIRADQIAFDSTVQAEIERSMNQTSTPVLGEKDFGVTMSDCGKSEASVDKGFWSIIVLGFLGGLVALLTPCVFPMIPLTVSFFTKRSESKTKGRFEAFFYSFSIVMIYFLLAVPFLIFNISPDTLNEISTGAPLNVFFFVIFVVFAFSFFGFYEISLPSFIANKADSASNVGGLIGIFFMALTLAIVSFSCTGPILGSLLVGALSSSSGKLNLVAGMTSFGLALALPFGLFALFPNMMKSLPKSGGWLNTVKVTLGFVELILAVKFLSNADLVAHWGILKREVFLGLWALLGAGTFIYLMGWFRFSNESPVNRLSPIRLSAAALALLFTIYTAYGIPGNDLHLFSDFPPPKFYSLVESRSGIESVKNNYEAALAKAKAENKLLMLDFTGWACVNCRKMEENVWPDQEVMERLNERFVIASLYVDDKKELPKNEQYISEVFNGKKIKTVGNKFSEMQAKYFGANTQPYYVLLSPDEKLLTHPRGYTPDPKEYVDFLDCAWNTYRQVGQK